MRIHLKTTANTSAKTDFFRLLETVQKDSLQEKLNEKMRRDDELERMRR